MNKKNNYNELAYIIENPRIGKGTWIGPFTVIDGSGGLEIGENCDISCGVHIYTHDTVKRCINGKKFDEQGNVRRDLIEKSNVKIGDYTFIGANSTILKGIKIGSHCVIAAGSVVTKNIPDFSVVGGQPAKILGYIIKNKDGEYEIVIKK